MDTNCCTEGVDTSYGSHTVEEFWGVELSKDDREKKWEEEDEEDLSSETVLELRQACLGANAKEGERNVVEVTTEDSEGDMSTHTILSLRVGGAEQSALFLSLHNPTTFKLVKGSGPVSLVGQKNMIVNMDMIDSDDSDEDEETTREIETKIADLKAQVLSGKRPATSPSKPPAKVAKVDAAKDVNNPDNWDDDSEDDEDYEDSDDTDEEDEDSEDEKDEDEDESSEEEEAPTLTPAKKVQDKPSRPNVGKPTPNGKPNGKPTPGGGKGVTPSGKGGKPTPKSGKDKPFVSFKTPQPEKGGKKQKGGFSLPSTPFESKKSPGKGAPDIETVKQQLLKMSLPKKLEKFNNFVSNSFKIKDAAVKKQLWEYVQKNKAN